MTSRHVDPTGGPIPTTTAAPSPSSRSYIVVEGEDLLDRLNRCLGYFKVKVLQRDITELYGYHPSGDPAAALLGKGSYGDAFRMQSRRNREEPVRVVKKIPKARITQNAQQIQHVCAEIAASTNLHHPNLNRCVGLYHTATHLFMVLEMCEGPTPDIRTRLYHLFAKYSPKRIALVEGMVEQYEKDWENLKLERAEERKKIGGIAPTPAMLQYEEEQFYEDKVQSVLNDLGRSITSSSSRINRGETGGMPPSANASLTSLPGSPATLPHEAPTQCDLSGCILSRKRPIPDLKAAVIMKQCLEGLDYMHSNQVVHRDVKLENIVIGETRSSETIKNDEGEIVGVRIQEKIQVKLIDFGLVKYLKLSSFFPLTPSPGLFARASGGREGSELGDPFLDAVVPSTPVGTPIYQPLEAIAGILQMKTGSKSGCGKDGTTTSEHSNNSINNNTINNKWMSTARSLPKLDIYGAGAVLFALANRRPPFKFPTKDKKQYDEDEELASKQWLKDCQDILEAGPTYHPRVTDYAKSMINVLLNLDLNRRPSAADALRLPYFKGIDDTFSYEVGVDGSVKYLLPVGGVGTTTGGGGLAPVNVSAAGSRRGSIQVGLTKSSSLGSATTTVSNATFTSEGPSTATILGKLPGSPAFSTSGRADSSTTTGGEEGGGTTGGGFSRINNNNTAAKGNPHPPGSITVSIANTNKTRVSSRGSSPLPAPSGGKEPSPAPREPSTPQQVEGCSRGGTDSATVMGKGGDVNDEGEEDLEETEEEKQRVKEELRDCGLMMVQRGHEDAGDAEGKPETPSSPPLKIPILSEAPSPLRLSGGNTARGGDGSSTPSSSLSRARTSSPSPSPSAPVTTYAAVPQMQKLSPQRPVILDVGSGETTRNDVVVQRKDDSAGRVTKTRSPPASKGDGAGASTGGGLVIPSPVIISKSSSNSGGVSMTTRRPPSERTRPPPLPPLDSSLASTIPVVSKPAERDGARSPVANQHES